MRRAVILISLLTLSVALARRDVGVRRFQPCGELHGRGPFGCGVELWNYGDSIEYDVPVRMWVDSAGVRMHEATGLTWAPLRPNHWQNVTVRPAWSPYPGYCTYDVTAIVELPEDQNRANDTLRDTARVILARTSDEFLTELNHHGSIDIDGHLAEWWAGAYDISDSAGRAGPQRRLGTCLFHIGHSSDSVYFGIDAIVAHTREDGDRVIVKLDENRNGLWDPDSVEGTYTILVSGGIDSVIYSHLLSRQCPGCTSASSLASGNLQFEARLPIGSEFWAVDVNPDSDSSGIAVSFWRGDSCYGWWSRWLTLPEWEEPASYGVLNWISMGTAAGRPTEHRSAGGVTVLDGVLPLRGRAPAVLLDITGRKVMDLKPGENDVRHLAPGVYFVIPSPQSSPARGEEVAVRKVVIRR